MGRDVSPLENAPLTETTTGDSLEYGHCSEEGIFDRRIIFYMGKYLASLLNKVDSTNRCEASQEVMSLNYV